MRRPGREILDTHQPRGERDASKIPEQTPQAAVTSACCVWGVARLFPAQPHRPTAAPSGTWATEAPQQLVAHPGAPASRACLFPLGPGLLPAPGVEDPQGPLPGGTLRRSGGASAPGGAPQDNRGSRLPTGPWCCFRPIPSAPLCSRLTHSVYERRGGSGRGRESPRGHTAPEWRGPRTSQGDSWTVTKMSQWWPCRQGHDSPPRAPPSL